jgi:formate hydrogenlyase transcriptional activator
MFATPITAIERPHLAVSSRQGLIGTSPAIQEVWSAIEMVAPTDSAVLICGETGTGKELAAQAVHQASRRHHRPFVKINCAAIPGGLLESELFGHARGAFTGAVAETAGRFHMAHQGTLFLDEIGDLPLELQPKLLRVLQEQEFERLGSTRTIRVDVRIVAATNRDLGQMVLDRQFRADLYYRLNVFPITMPSLCERISDIPELAHHFVRIFAARMNKTIREIPDDVMDMLVAHEWPGNIRELQNVIERAAILTQGPVLCLPPMKRSEAGPRANVPSKPGTLLEAQREHILAVLREADWVVGGRRGAAARLGLPRTTLIHKMRKLGITQPGSLEGAA